MSRINPPHWTPTDFAPSAAQAQAARDDAAGNAFAVAVGVLDLPRHEAVSVLFRECGLNDAAALRLLADAAEARALDREIRALGAARDAALELARRARR